MVNLAGCSCLARAHQRQATLVQQRTSMWQMSTAESSSGQRDLSRWKGDTGEERTGVTWVALGVQAVQGVF